MRIVPAVALLAFSVSCSKEPEGGPPVKPAKAPVVRVDGMQRGEGGKT